MQFKGAERAQRPLFGSDAQAVAQEGVSSGTGEHLPYREAIQTAFGAHDVSGVRAHVGGKAAQATSELGASRMRRATRLSSGRSPTFTPRPMRPHTLFSSEQAFT